MFVNPPGYGTNEYPPLGMLYLAAVARQNGYKVDLYDAGVVETRLDAALDYVEQANPDVLAFSLYTTNLLDTYHFIENLVKKLRPIIIVGGPHATALPRATMEECQYIDYLVYGEGEVTFIEFLNALRDGKSLAEIDGLYYRQSESILNTKPRTFIENLDQIPFAAWDLIQKYKYPMDAVRKGERVAPIATSRGCPYNCAFCNKAVFGRRYRRRSPESVVKEIEFLTIKNGLDEIFFVDDLFALDRRWLAEFYQLLDAKNIKIPWKCLGRVDILQYEDFLEMKRHGCFVIQLGIESGNDHILEDINKNITTGQAEKAVKEAKRAGLDVHTYFILGHRLDTVESIKQTIAFARKLNSDFVSFFVLVPFPGTKVYEYVPQHLKNSWDRMSYYHDTTNPISICEVEPEKLLDLVKWAFASFFIRFRYLLGNIVLSKDSLHLKKIKFFMGLWSFKDYLLHKLRRIK